MEEIVNTLAKNLNDLDEYVGRTVKCRHHQIRKLNRSARFLSFAGVVYFIVSEIRYRNTQRELKELKTQKGE